MAQRAKNFPKVVAEQAKNSILKNQKRCIVPEIIDVEDGEICSILKNQKLREAPKFLEFSLLIETKYVIL